MRKNRALLNVTVLFLATLLGWCLRGVFDEFIRADSSTAVQTSKDPAKTGGGQPQSLPPSALHDGSAGSGSGSGPEPVADDRPYAASVESAPVQEGPQPAEPLQTVMLPPDLKPGDIETSPEAGVARLVRVRPGNVQSQPASQIMLPPDLNPGDVELSPDGMTLLLVRPRPPAPQSQSPPTAIPPELRDQLGGASPDGMVLKKLPPDVKPPAAAPAPKPPKQ